jgi:hypothetical protein
VLLCGQSDVQDPATGEWRTLPGSELHGPSGERQKELAATQWSWLTERLSSSDADFVWVAGHFPIWSAGKDGTVPLLVRKLLPLLSASGAHYFSGHDHMWQHLVDGPSGTHMFQAGAGKECCYENTHQWTVPEGYLQFMVSGPQGNGTSVGYDGPSKGQLQGGFGSMVFCDESVQVSFHDQDGNYIYQPPPVARRTAAQRNRNNRNSSRNSSRSRSRPSQGDPDTDDAELEYESNHDDFWAFAKCTFPGENKRCLQNDDCADHSVGRQECHCCMNPCSSGMGSCCIPCD